MKGLKLSVPLPDLWGGGMSCKLYWSPMANDLISRVSVMKPGKIPEGQDLESFRVGEHLAIRREHESSIPFSGTLPSTSLPCGCLSYILCNELGI